jgi:hypothetical protein
MLGFPLLSHPLSFLVTVPSSTKVKAILHLTLEPSALRLRRDFRRRNTLYRHFETMFQLHVVNVNTHK